MRQRGVMQTEQLTMGRLRACIQFSSRGAAPVEGQRRGKAETAALEGSLQP